MKEQAAFITPPINAWRRLSVPILTPSSLQVTPGMIAAAGQPLAIGRWGADTLAPLTGTVAAIDYRPPAMADTTPLLCVSLTELSTPPQTPTVPTDADWPSRLKRAGIVGLGGGAFPAWRKYRLGLQRMVVNAMESDPSAGHDASLINTHRQTLLDDIAAVAEAFHAAPLLALREDLLPGCSHPMIHRLPVDFALGSERLLIQQLTGDRFPTGHRPVDYGTVCFNVGTVLAMAALLKDDRPLLHRFVTVHAGENLSRQVLQIPFGASVGDIRRHLKCPTEPPARDGDDIPLPDDAVICAGGGVLRFVQPPAAPAAVPCIRCGECVPVCPAALSPWRLHQLNADRRDDDMRQERLDDCLTCRRCDAVCPSHLPLSATFATAQRRHRRQRQMAELREERQRRHEHHLRRRQQKPADRWLPPDALSG